MAGFARLFDAQLFDNKQGNCIPCTLRWIGLEDMEEMEHKQEHWLVLEQWLRDITQVYSLERKNGGDMADHWIRVGRALCARGADDITICGGYCHDIIEDVPEVSTDNLYAMLEVVLGNRIDSNAALALVHDCSYSPDEYALEKHLACIIGAKAAKSVRKNLACARWLSSTDPRVHTVKIEDISDNNLDCTNVSVQFATEYRLWALPLRKALEDKLLLSSTTIPDFSNTGHQELP